jgi:hypothetical protein
VKKYYALAFACLGLLAPGATYAQTSADSAAVIRAGLDYIEGFYEGDTAKLKRSVRTNVVKYGFWRAQNATTFAPDTMSYGQFMSYAESVKARGGTKGPNASIKKVELLDVMSHIASLKVTAWWGVDYLQLGKYDGQWMIAHVIWQSPPAATK